MQLDEFYDYKNTLMGDILTNPKLVSLLSAEDENGEKIYTLKNSKELAYKQVFPCEYIPETLHDGSTMICFDVDVQQVNNKTFYEPTLYIWVLAHRSRLRLPDGGGVRVDAICSELCKTINGSRKYGLGELNLYAIKRWAPLTDFIGKMMTFHAKDFNRPYTPDKYTPANRKRGV